METGCIPGRIHCGECDEILAWEGQALPAAGVVCPRCHSRNLPDGSLIGCSPQAIDTPEMQNAARKALDDEAWRLFNTPMDQLDPALLEELRGFQCGEDALWRIRKYLMREGAGQ